MFNSKVCVLCWLTQTLFIIILTFVYMLHEECVFEVFLLNRYLRKWTGKYALHCWALIILWMKYLNSLISYATWNKSNLWRHAVCLEFITVLLNCTKCWLSCFATRFCAWLEIVTCVSLSALTFWFFQFLVDTVWIG